MSIRFLLKKAGVLTELQGKHTALLAETIKNSGLVGTEFAQCGFNLECGSCAVKISPEIEEAIQELKKKAVELATSKVFGLVPIL